MRRTAAGVVMATEMVWPLRTPKSWTLYSGCSLNYADFNLLRRQSGSEGNKQKELTVLVHSSQPLSSLSSTVDVSAAPRAARLDRGDL